MTPERWGHIDKLLDQALNRPPGQRDAFLDSVCAGDEDARDEIASLLSFRELANSFLETPLHDFVFAPIEPLTGKLLGSYKIEEELGHGAMGQVYLAHDTKLDRKVAIKVLPLELEAGERMGRLIGEAKAAARLDHHSICAIHEVAEEDGHSFIVMPYIEGETLASRVRRQPLSVSESLDLVYQIAGALSEAHSHGIVHRDIKPQNIMITPKGQVKVLDFGIAKFIGVSEIDSRDVQARPLVTAPGVIAGTPPYMSPEQARGTTVDTRSDLFSLGVVLYECVTGIRPFSGANALEIFEKIINVDPPPPSHLNPKVPPKLDKMILKALAKDPSARYQKAGELREDILHIQTPGEKAGKTVEMRRWLLAGWRKFLLVAAASVLLAILLSPIISKRLIVRPYVPKAAAQALYQEGLDASGIGAYYTASERFQQAIQEDEHFALAQARLASAYLELRYTDKANGEWAKVGSLVLDRSELPQLDRLALEAIMQTLKPDASGAVESYREILETATGSDKERAHFDLARAYEVNNENRDAILLHYLAATPVERPNPGALLQLGILYSESKEDRQKARESFDIAENVYEEKGCREGSIEVNLHRGEFLQDAGEPLEALAQLNLAYDRAEATGNKNQQVRSLLLMSRVLSDQQRLDEAREKAKLASEMAQEDGYRELSTEALLDIGDLFRNLGKYDDALAQIGEARKRARLNKESRNEGRALLLIATVYADLHEVDLALEFIKPALDLAEKPGLEERKLYLRELLAETLDLKGDSLAAEESYRTLLEEAEQRNLPQRIATSYQALSQVSIHRGLLPEALQMSISSYEEFKSQSSTSGVIESLTNIADTLGQLGRFVEADEKLKLTSETLNLPGYEGTIENAKIARLRVRLAISQEMMPEGVDKRGFTSSLNPTNEAGIDVEIKSALGLALCRSGRTRKGIDLCTEAVELAIQKKMAPWISSPAKLALAEALLLGRKRNALARADEAIREFLPNDNLEFQWRAFVIAARASRLVADDSNAHAYAVRAQDSLSSLRTQWGETHYSSYANRPDIKTLRRHLRALLVPMNKQYQP